LSVCCTGWPQPAAATADDKALSVADQTAVQ
jgi:hypothetical protein